MTTDETRPDDEGRDDEPQGTHGPQDTEGAGTEGPDAAEHDVTGLDLARSVARGLAGRTGPLRPGRSRGAGRGERVPGRLGARRGAPVGSQGSGAHPSERDPQTLDSSLGRLVSDQGWTTDLRVHGIFGRWAQIVGQDVAAHSAPESFVDGKLVVRTDSTAWATQMRLLAGTVVRRLNEDLGDGTIRVIDVQGPKPPSWSKGRRSIRGARGPRDTYG